MFDLTKELKKFVPYNDREKQDVERTLEFLKGEHCYDRTNTKGHITAGAFVCSKDGEVLLNHHTASGMWFQFGGHSDGESDSFNVAKREVFEEAGIEKFEVLKPGIFDVNVEEIEDRPQKNESAHIHYDINFLFCVEDKNFTISEESMDIKWVSIEQAKTLVNKDDLGMQRMLEKYEKILKDKKSQ